MYGSNRTTIKFGMEGNKKALYQRHGQRPPMTLLEFEPTNLTEQQLNQYAGKYYSDELEVTYDFKIEENKLCVYLGEKKIVQFNPLMEALFNSDHDGYLKFEPESNGKLDKCTINDYSLGTMSFVKIYK